MGSPHGYTRQPCQGCGSTELRQKGKLCSECQSIYDDGLLALKKQTEQKAKIIVKHDKAHHLISGPYLFDHSAMYLSGILCNRIRKAWSRLTMSVLEQAVGGHHRDTPYLIDNKEYIGKDPIRTWGTKNNFYGYHSDEYFLVKATVKDALNELDIAMRLALEFVYLAGRKQGLSILTQLNEGNTSLSSLNDNSTKTDKRLDAIKTLCEEV